MRASPLQLLRPALGGGRILGVSQPDVNTVAGMATGRALISDEKWGT